MALARSRNAAFTRYWSAEVGLALGQEIFLVAVGWQVYALTGSALALGFVGLAQFLPQFLLALAAGHVADSFDRRRTAFACQLLKFAGAVALVAANSAGPVADTAIYAAALAVGTAHAFQQPALRALMPTLVAREELPRCIAWNSGVRKAAIVAGPAVGGLVYLAGPVVAYAAAALCYLGAGVLLLSIRLAGSALPAREPLTLASVFGGITFIRGHRVILGAVSLDLFATLLGGATALLPIYAKDILDCGPGGLGLLRAAPAFGAVLVSLALVRLPLERHAGRVMFAAVAAFGLATVVFGLSRSFALSLAALAAIGAADMVSVVIRTSLIQLQTPDGMRGRVAAVNSIFTGTSNHLGQFESGLVAAWLGAVASVVIGGVGTLLVAALWIRWFPALWRSDRLAGGEPL